MCDVRMLHRCQNIVLEPYVLYRLVALVPAKVSLGRVHIPLRAEAQEHGASTALSARKRGSQWVLLLRCFNCAYRINERAPLLTIAYYLH